MAALKERRSPDRKGSCVDNQCVWENHSNSNSSVDVAILSIDTIVVVRVVLCQLTIFLVLPSSLEQNEIRCN